MNAPIVIRAQQGQQEKFLATAADIAFYGGSAGGGKSYGLLLKPLTHITTRPGYGAVIFRKTTQNIRQEGGLWSTSLKIYPKLGARPRESTLDWAFNCKGQSNWLKFNHLEHDSILERDHQGGQYPFIGIDEATHFSLYAFFYLLSRNRSPCGIRPIMRLTCNPDSQSWVAKFIEWWIDPITGYPIPERDGVLRYFVREGDNIIWASSKEELPVVKDDHANIVEPKSVTFIRSNLYDNPILMNADPGYLGTLMSLPMVEREQLLKGNWKIARAQGTFFKRENLPIVDACPAAERELWYWDRASTEPRGDDDPDWTVGVHMRRTVAQTYVVMNVVRFRGTPAKVEAAIKTIAGENAHLTQFLEQDPGSAGVAEISYLVRALAGFSVQSVKVDVNKVTRALPLVSQAEVGNFSLMRGAWNEAYISELTAFGPDEDEYAHDDQVDASSGAFNALARPNDPRVRRL